MSRPPPTHAPQPVSELSWSRVVVFLTVAGLILLGTSAFVCATLAHFLKLQREGEAQILSGLLTLGFLAATVVGRLTSGRLLRLVYTVTAVWLGLLNYLFFAALGCWAIDAVISAIGWPAHGVVLAGSLFGLAVVVAVWGVMNAARLRITEVTVSLPQLPQTWVGRRIALITDLHLGHVQGPYFLQRVLERLRHLQPDLVLISGDMFDGTKHGLKRLVQPWSEFQAPLGIYFVTGNHDEFADRQIYLAALAQVGVEALHNKRVVLDGLQLVGVHDGETGDPAAFRALLGNLAIDRARPSILLAHKPENLRIAEEEGISLQLSGHTHRGQLWPWTMLVKRIYGPFAYGLHRLDRLQVYTSSGVGTWGPPVRVGTRSEIVLLRLTATAP